MTENREKIIIKTSVIGIIANVLLAAFKAVVGLLTHSIAIVMDAVNNITDAGSSIITIIGTRLAGKEPDKKHPFGHGRIEYMSAMVIAILILYAGLTSFIESVKKIIHPSTPDYTTVSLMIIAVAVAVKLVLGRYVKSIGEKVNSASLVNSGTDALMDAIISTSTLAAALIFMMFNISLEAYLAAIISIVIIKSGYDMLSETISKILGESNDKELAQAIVKTVKAFPDVLGAYDLVLNNYGPNTWSGSIHIELPDTYTADMIDKLVREIQVKVAKEHHVVLTAIGIYSQNTHDQLARNMRKKVEEIALSHEYVKELHGFYLIKNPKTIRCDIVISFDAENRREVFNQVLDQIQEAFPDYQLQIALDSDFSEE